MTAVASGRRDLLFFLLMGTARAAPPEGDFLARAVAVLAHEKAIAEEAVSLVKLYAKDDRATQIGAIQRYGEARAAFNAFIERLIHDNDVQAPEPTVSYENELAKAVQARDAFVTFVRDKVMAQQPPGSKGPIGDLMGGAASLLKSLVESGVIIRREIRSDRAERREAIRRQLEGLKWAQFSQIS